MNLPTQSFPTDVTAPTPTQLPGPTPSRTEGTDLPAKSPPPPLRRKDENGEGSESEPAQSTRDDFFRLAKKPPSRDSSETYRDAEAKRS